MPSFERLNINEGKSEGNPQKFQKFHKMSDSFCVHKYVITMSLLNPYCLSQMYIVISIVMD